MGAISNGRKYNWKGFHGFMDLGVETLPREEDVINILISTE
jgi:hypothetical protein